MEGWNSFRWGWSTNINHLETSDEGVAVVSTHTMTIEAVDVRAHCFLYEVACWGPYKWRCIEASGRRSSMAVVRQFASKICSSSKNVRLGLRLDGFNPFGNMSTSHSTWPIMIIPYNLPPWMCMKQTSFILSLIIPGPKSHEIDIDVYL